VVTEQADERSWRTLPERISVARATLPQGSQTIEFQTGTGTYRKEVVIGNRFTIIPIRIASGAVYVGQTNILGSGLSDVGVSGKPASKKPAKKTNL